VATTTTKLFDRDKSKSYVITQYDLFREQTEATLLGLAAAGMLVWMDHAKSTFSASTGARYLESLYWEAENPYEIKMGVLPNTLADLLEHGQDPHDLNPFFLRNAKASGGRKRGKGKGTPPEPRRAPGPKASSRRVIPMTPRKGLGRLEYSGEERYSAPFLLSMEGIKHTLKTQPPRMAKFQIKGPMSSFNKAAAKSHTYKERASFIRNENTQFRTITPETAWQHPGIRAALLGNQVSSWMEANRESFVGNMFGGEAGILLPPGYEP
jgi:hypothetical protein